MATFDMQDALNHSLDILNHYPGPIALLAAIAGSATVALFVKRWMEKPRTSGDDSEMKRRAQLDQMFADDFGDVLFDRLMKQDITRHEYKKACVRFGIAYRLADLLVRKNGKRGLKHRVQNNCAVMHRSPAPKLPADTKPVVVAVVAKRKVWIVPRKRN